MAKLRQPTVSAKAPTAEATPRFTDPDQVLEYLNGTLSKDFQHIPELAADMDRFLQESGASRDSLLESLAQVREETENRLEALAVGLKELEQATATVEDKSRALDASIAEAKASAGYVIAQGENISDEHESRWAETKQQARHQSDLLAQRLSDQVATHAGEIQGANQAWRTQVEAANQTWRKQVEAANQAWQLTQAQHAEQWRTGLAKEMVERTDASAKQSRTALEQTNAQAKAIAQLSQRQSESQQTLQHQIEATHAEWKAATQAQESNIAALQSSIAFMRKLLYGAGAAIAVLTLLCIIALVH